jgi:hypothetical protein
VSASVAGLRSQVSRCAVPDVYTFADDAHGLFRLRLRHPRPRWSRPVRNNVCSMFARMPRYGPALPGIRSAPRIPATGQNGSSRHVLASLNSTSRRINEQSSGLLICGYACLVQRRRHAPLGRSPAMAGLSRPRLFGRAWARRQPFRPRERFGEPLAPATGREHRACHTTGAHDRRRCPLTCIAAVMASGPAGGPLYGLGRVSLCSLALIAAGSCERAAGSGGAERPRSGAAGALDAAARERIMAGGGKGANRGRRFRWLAWAFLPGGRGDLLHGGTGDGGGSQAYLGPRALTCARRHDD